MVVSDMGAAPRMDWTLQGQPYEAALLKWGLPLLPHLYEDFANTSSLPNFEVSLDRLLIQEAHSLDRVWTKTFSQKTEICLLGRLLNLSGERSATERELKLLAQCVSEVSPRWFALSVGFNRTAGYALQHPLPMPRTQETIETISARVKQIRSVCGCDVALVNVSSMFKYSLEQYSEVEFWCRLIEKTGCQFILDIPAFFVSLYHAGLDFEPEMKKLPLQSIAGVRIGALALSTHGVVDAECGRLSMTHWGLLEDVLHALPEGKRRTVFLKWFEPLVRCDDLIAETENGQSALNRLSEV
jgi:uncharacterized protein (UPF0276 family)